MTPISFFKFPEIVSGQTWLDWHLPIIYGWFRGDKCLYVGKSDGGIKRILNGHHVIGVIDQVRSTDQFRIITVVLDSSDPEHLAKLEKRFIRKYSPAYNVTHNEIANYEHHVTTKGLPQLSTAFSTQKELAEVLLDEVSKRTVLVDPQNCQNLSDEDLDGAVRDLAQLKALDRRVNRNGQP